MTQPRAAGAKRGSIATPPKVIAAQTTTIGVSTGDRCSAAGAVSIVRTEPTSTASMRTQAGSASATANVSRAPATNSCQPAGPAASARTRAYLSWSACQIGRTALSGAQIAGAPRIASRIATASADMPAATCGPRRDAGGSASTARPATATAPAAKSGKWSGRATEPTRVIVVMTVTVARPAARSGSGPRRSVSPPPRPTAAVNNATRAARRVVVVPNATAPYATAAPNDTANSSHDISCSSAGARAQAGGGGPSSAGAAGAGGMSVIGRVLTPGARPAQMARSTAATPVNTSAQPAGPLIQW